MYNLSVFTQDKTLFNEFRASIFEGKPVVRIRDAKIKLVGRCNLRCDFCQFWRLQEREELTTEEVKRVVDDLAALDCQKIHFTGGEATLRKDLADIVAHTTRQGIKANLTTNGTLLTPETACALVEAGLNWAALSLDAATPRLHDAIRGVKGAFKRTVRGLKFLQDARRKTKAKLRVRLNMVLTRHNYHEYPDLLALAGELGVSEVIPLPVDERGKSRNRLLPQQLREFNEVIAPAVAEIRARCGFSTAPHLVYPFGVGKGDLRHSANVEYARGYFKDHVCYVPWLHTLINWKGDVFLCCMTRNKIPPIGNVRQTPLRDIFLGEKYETIRRMFTTERFAVCHRCDNFLAENQFLEGSLAQRRDGCVITAHCSQDTAPCRAGLAVR
jgi:MoaA/NifB/PqqE/SkfB family radical SAM enzyme